MGPWCRSSTVTLVAGDERTIIAIVAPHPSETSYTTHPLFGRANLPVCPNLKNPPVCQCCHQKNPPEPNLFPETQWFKNGDPCGSPVTPGIKGFQVI
jgi:hypothetical protein